MGGKPTPAATDFSRLPSRNLYAPGATVDAMEPTDTLIAFVVRVHWTGADEVTGVVERVRTGEKHRFHAVAEVGPLIAEMLREGDKP
jgi:hypothetical protein